MTSQLLVPIHTTLLRFVVALLISSASYDVVRAAETRSPNVILVMTDDQGYGDLGCHGNPVLKTPALDRLASESVRLTNYHVDPTCSPTRAALMSGRYSSRTGVWHTIMGRSIMRKDEVTMAQLFARARYRTGIFGKWHLGDNYPYRPQDRGFQEVLIHGGGGIGQAPDYWGNDYHDDTYRHNGRYETFKGYCTDVWFDAALKFIADNRDRPFFAYIPTNAAHGPFLVDKKYSAPYLKQGVPSPRAEFYGMIANIDENIARLDQALARWGLTENTILIFTTDNGTAAGMRDKAGFNAGLRGAKGSEYEGGHRVPCFVRWPAGKLTGGRDVPALTAHIDLLPTLRELCGLAQPDGIPLDGVSLASLLSGESNQLDRTLFVHSQRIEHPEKWRKSAVMTDRWRLVNGRELYDLQTDPGQKSDIAPLHPQVVQSLRAAYEGWWRETSTRFAEYVRLELGAPQENPTTLLSHDWHAPIKQVPWNQEQIKQSLAGNGFWAIDVLRAGRYEITLRDRPSYVEHRLQAAAARLKTGAGEDRQMIGKGADSVTFRVDLKQGPSRLQTWFEEKDGTSRGAYFVDVKYVERSH